MIEVRKEEEKIDQKIANMGPERVRLSSYLWKTEISPILHMTERDIMGNDVLKSAGSLMAR